jgi:hypothetical protein
MGLRAVWAPYPRGHAHQPGLRRVDADATLRRLADLPEILARLPGDTGGLK